MNITFNEVSFRPFLANEYSLKEAFKELLKLYKKLNDQYNLDHLVFPSNIAEKQVLSERNFYQWINGLNGLDKQQILSSIKKPFTNDILENDSEILDSYTFQNAELGIEEDFCIGLGIAHLQESASMSLQSHHFWSENVIAINRTDLVTFVPREVSVFNIANGETMNKEIVDFLEFNRTIELIETDINPELKAIHLRDDHGIDVLEQFARRIVQSGFVISVINSLPFNRHTTRFIRRIFRDGTIEIVLHWEDDGYGMVIQTTGRNYHETKAIADILRHRYDH